MVVGEDHSLIVLEQRNLRSDRTFELLSTSWLRRARWLWFFGLMVVGRVSRSRHCCVLAGSSHVGDTPTWQRRRSTRARRRAARCATT